MPAGLEIRNSHGSVLIDSNNPTLVHVATYTQANITGGGLGGKLVLTDATNDTVLAYSGATSTVNSHVAKMGGTTREYWFPSISSSTPLKIYRFERVRDLGTNYGLVLRDGAGNVTFDAVQKPGRVVQAMSATGNITAPAGRSYAIVFAQMRYTTTHDAYDPEDGGGLILHTVTTQTRGSVSGQTVYFSANQVIFENTQRQPIGEPIPPSYAEGSPLGVVVDVTGY